MGQILHSLQLLVNRLRNTVVQQIIEDICQQKLVYKFLCITIFTIYPVLLKILGLQKNIQKFSKMLHFQWFGLGISWGFPGLPLHQKMAVTLSHFFAASPTILVGIPIYLHLGHFLIVFKCIYIYIHTHTYVHLSQKSTKCR